ncbi:MAG: hypothetical protein J6S14_11695 [Clostridia bacterium]|nr:hypothetical protein [Clostridia bacterium]
MIRYEDHCCECAAPGYPCLGSSCPNRNVPVYYCDKCGDEMEEVYKVDGEDLCEECLKDHFRKKEDDDD